MITFPEISPYIFTFGKSNFGPTWYGLMYVIGFMLGYWLALKKADKSPYWQRKEVESLLTYCILGVILGGRIGYVFIYQFPRFIEDPFYLLMIQDGGMSFHGGLIGVLIAVFLFKRKFHKTFFQVTDFIAPLFPIGLFFGRIGNFINGELWGRPTDVPWAVIFPRVEGARHPSQLYEAGLEGLLLFAVLYYLSNKQLASGRVSGVFLIGYGLSRFIVEFFREPDAHIGFIAMNWLTMGQIQSLPMVAFGLYLLLRRVR